MGDISIIARRLPNGEVEYGWGGNGGYFTMVGHRLSSWYNTPNDVNYLFSLGQTQLIGKKGSEYGGFGILFTHQPTGKPFWRGKTEREIFSKIAFVDYGYFYDLDNKWYYIIPGPFRIKIPFGLIEHYLETADNEFGYCTEVSKLIIKYIFTEYRNDNSDFSDFLIQNGYEDAESIMNDILSDEGFPVHRLFEKYHKIFKYFDDWILIVTDKSESEISRIIVCKAEEQHSETSLWRLE